MGSSAYYAGMAEYMAQANQRIGKNQRQHGNPKLERNRLLPLAGYAPPNHMKSSSSSIREEIRPSQNPRVTNAPHVTSARAAFPQPPTIAAAHVSISPNSLHSAIQAPTSAPATGKKPTPKPATKPAAAALHVPAMRTTANGYPREPPTPLGLPTPAHPTIIFVAMVYPPTPAPTPKHAPSHAPSHPPIRCFRDDDTVFPEHLVERNSLGEPGMRTKLEIGYSPWAMSLMEGFPASEPAKAKEIEGGGTGGGGPRGGDGDSGGGGGGGDDEEWEPAFLLPVLTLGFALLHLLYCIVIYIKDDGFEPEFGRTGLGLFGLLAVSAIRMSCRSGIEGLILGLGASIGVMVWSAERSYVKREMTPAGFIAVFSAVMSSLFTGALYHSV